MALMSSGASIMSPQNPTKKAQVCTRQITSGPFSTSLSSFNCFCVSSFDNDEKSISKVSFLTVAITSHLILSFDDFGYFVRLLRLHHSTSSLHCYWIRQSACLLWHMTQLLFSASIHMVIVSFSTLWSCVRLVVFLRCLPVFLSVSVHYL